MKLHWTTALVLLAFPAGFVLGMREYSFVGAREREHQYQLFLREEGRQRGVLIIPMPQSSDAHG